MNQPLWIALFVALGLMAAISYMEWDGVRLMVGCEPEPYDLDTPTYSSGDTSPQWEQQTPQPPRPDPPFHCFSLNHATSCSATNEQCIRYRDLIVSRTDEDEAITVCAPHHDDAWCYVVDNLGANRACFLKQEICVTNRDRMVRRTTPVSPCYRDDGRGFSCLRSTTDPTQTLCFRSEKACTIARVHIARKFPNESLMACQSVDQMACFTVGSADPAKMNTDNEQCYEHLEGCLADQRKVPEHQIVLEACRTFTK